MATMTFICAQILITWSGLTGNVSIRTTCSVFDDLDLTNTIVLCWRYYQNNAGRLFIGSILKIHFGPETFEHRVQARAVFPQKCTDTYNLAYNLGLLNAVKSVYNPCWYSLQVNT